ncbi:hypothetical protein MPSEU_000029000 [Mayamaea pseudoterrestris]|nr:hypothetical protein MPSEU_000029000 [Mayamaea pseudoterrestris]
MSETTKDNRINKNKEALDSSSSNYSIAIIRTLRSAGVKFLRYSATDLCGNARCKVVPLVYLHKNHISVSNGVSFASACFGGLPSYADCIIPETGLTAASGSVRLEPAMETLRILPYARQSALVICNLVDTATGQRSEYCSRSVLQKLLQICKEIHNIGFNIGAELEFTLYNLAGEPVDGCHYGASTTLNQQQSFISDVYEQLAVQQDVDIELLHSESAPGQLELVLRHQDDAVRLADYAFLAKETIIAVAHQHQLKAIFLPKTDANQAGNGLHLHISMYSTEPGRFISQDTRSSFLKGILQQLDSLLALTLPSMNSFARVGPGCWTGHDASWGMDDKEAAIRVLSHDFEHFEYKLCDAKANLYLALAGILWAGMVGINYRLKLRPSRQDTNLEAVAQLPTSLLQSLNFLKDYDLLSHEMSPALLKAYIALKRAEAKHDEKLTMSDQLNLALTE